MRNGLPLHPTQKPNVVLSGLEDGGPTSARSHFSSGSQHKAADFPRESSSEPHPCMLTALTATDEEPTVMKPVVMQARLPEPRRPRLVNVVSAEPLPPLAPESLEPFSEQQQMVWLMQEHLEAHKISMEAMLQEQSRQAARQAAKQCERIEGLLDQHHNTFGAQFEASALKLQRQEQKLEEHLERLMQHQNSIDVLNGTRTPRLSFMPGALGAAGAADSGVEKWGEELAKKIEANNQQCLKAMQQQHASDINNLMLSHPLFRSQEQRAGNGESVLLSEGDVGSDRGPPGNPELHRMGSAYSQDITALEAVQGLALSASKGDPSKQQRGSYMSTSSLPSFWKSSRGLRRSSNTLLDLVSACLILLNCAWMGLEAELSMDAIRADTTKPTAVSVVEATFAVIFSAELALRFLIQGSYFWKCPNLRLNLFDMVIVVIQVIDVLFTFYNVSWLRSFRILRLFNAARIVRSLDYVTQLRVLVSAIAASMSSLFWVLVLLFFVLYLCSVFVLQTIQGHVKNASDLDPDLLKYYGTIGECMLTLFMAITGGVPWDTLVKPLSNISIMFTLGYILYLTFVVFGLLNIVTAIFVESTKMLAQKDNDMHVKDLVSSEDSSINRLRKLFEEAEADSDGWLTEEELEIHLKDQRFVSQMRELGMEVWEARGLFQLLDTDALGRVGVDEFLHGMIRLKCKDKAVDLATVMYENKRILTRLLAFMRFSEDHFKDIQRYLGMHANAKGPSRTRVKNLEHYLQDVKNQSRAGDGLGAMMGEHSPLAGRRRST